MFYAYKKINPKYDPYGTQSPLSYHRGKGGQTQALKKHGSSFFFFFKTIRNHWYLVDMQLEEDDSTFFYKKQMSRLLCPV